MLKRIALALAVLLPAPALALEVKPYGVLFTDYSYDLTDVAGKPQGWSSFNLTRARVGFTAKVDQHSGAIITDIAPNAAGRYDTFLKFAWVEFGGDLGKVRLGQFPTFWSIPLEESWFPYRFQGMMFSTREGLFPTEDRGISWSNTFGPAQVSLGVFNGEGSGAFEGSGTKAYDALVRVLPMDGVDVAIFGRHSGGPDPVTYSDAGVGSLNLKLGPAVVGGQGAVLAKTTAKGTTTGFGGTGHVYMPELLAGHTPLLRADYFDEDPSNAKSGAHVRAIAGLSRKWTPQIETSLDNEYTVYLKNGKSATDVIALHAKLAF